MTVHERTRDLDRLAARVADADLELSRFTAEELLAAGPADAPLLEPAGWYAQLDPDAQQVARITALRSLTARGFVVPVEAGSDVAAPAYEPRGDLASVLSLRARARGVVRIEHHQPGGTSRRHAWLLCPGLVLDERANPDGYHASTLRTELSLATDVAARLDPDDLAARNRVTEAPCAPDAPDGDRGPGSPPDRFTELSELAAQARRRVRMLAALGGEEPTIMTNELAATTQGVVGIALDVDADGTSRPSAALLGADEVIPAVLGCLVPPLIEEAAT